MARNHKAVSVALSGDIVQKLTITNHTLTWWGKKRTASQWPRWFNAYISSSVKMNSWLVVNFSQSSWTQYVKAAEILRSPRRVPKIFLLCFRFHSPGAWFMWHGQHFVERFRFEAVFKVQTLFLLNWFSSSLFSTMQRFHSASLFWCYGCICV